MADWVEVPEVLIDITSDDEIPLTSSFVENIPPKNTGFQVSSLEDVYLAARQTDISGGASFQLRQACHSSRSISPVAKRQSSEIGDAFCHRSLEHTAGSSENRPVFSIPSWPHGVLSSNNSAIDLTQDASMRERVSKVPQLGLTSFSSHLAHEKLSAAMHQPSVLLHEKARRKRAESSDIPKVSKRASVATRSGSALLPNKSGRKSVLPKGTVAKATRRLRMSCGVQAAPCIQSGPPGVAHENFRTGLLHALMERLRFRGTVIRFGKTRGKKAWRKQTVLLRDLFTIDGQKVPKGLPATTDHVWLCVGKQIDNAKLRHGDMVEFNARVRWYRKAGGCDLKLSHHTKLTVIPGPHSSFNEFAPRATHYRNSKERNIALEASG